LYVSVVTLVSLPAARLPGARRWRRLDGPLRIVELGDLFRLDDHAPRAAADEAEYQQEHEDPAAHRPCSGRQATTAGGRWLKPSSGYCFIRSRIASTIFSSSSRVPFSRESLKIPCGQMIEVSSPFLEGVEEFTEPS
jgi:hypothetical protein